MADTDSQNPDDAPTVESGGGPLPALYQKPVLLDAQRHASYSLKENAGFAFAAKSNAMVLNGVEFPLAARHYPIVFAGNDTVVVPMVVLGVRRDENLFVQENGEWETGVYIPAYARRYPFVFTESADKSKLGLCIDEASEALVESDVRPLFKDGKRTAVVERALQFCTAYQREFEATKPFAQALVEHGLLTENRADLRLNSGERLAVAGFRVIDEKKFNQLPDDVFLEWRKRGWIALTYCHFVSVGNWQLLIDRVARKASGNGQG